MAKVDRKYAPITKEDDWFIGEHKVLIFSIVDVDNNVQDLTGWQMEWSLRTDADVEAGLLITKITPADIDLSRATEGIAQVTIDPDDYALIDEAGTFSHALIRSDEGQEAVVAYGEAVLRWAATR